MMTCLIAVTVAVSLVLVAGCEPDEADDAEVVVVDVGEGGVDKPSSAVSGAGGADAVAASTGVEGGGEALVPADGVKLEAIVLYQGVARPIMSHGEAVQSDVPIIANRRGLLRVFYRTDDAYDGAPVVARLILAGSPSMVETLALGSHSVEASPGSTINFHLDAGQLAGGALRVEILRLASEVSGSNHHASYPATAGELASIPVESGATLRVSLVPVLYLGDGSGRLPSTANEQLERYRNALFAIYPVAGVTLALRTKPLVWGRRVSSSGAGWGELLTAIADLRSRDGADPDEYYYGLVAPGGTYASYCSSGCVAGLGFMAGANDAWGRAAVGLGYAGEHFADIATHELGHNHGRSHAPCGAVAQGDPAYPYPGGKIGVFGYHILERHLYLPSALDLMGYCAPKWISDYNFGAIFRRTQLVAAAAVVEQMPEALASRTTYRRVALGEHRARWIEPVALARPPAGELTPVKARTAAGDELLEGRLVRFDHLPGGVLFVPEPRAPLVSRAPLSIAYQGRTVTLLAP